MLKVLVSVVFAFTFLSGCGGGGGTSTTPPNLSSAPSSSSVVAVSSSSLASSVAVSSSKSSSSMVSSSSTVSSMSSSSARSVAITIEASADWFGLDGVSVVKSNAGATVTYTADWKAAGLWIAKEKAAIENHTVEIDFVASSEFKTSGGNLYIYTIFDTPTAPFTDEKDCEWFMSTSIVVDTTQTIRCTISTNGGFSQTAIPIHIRLVARVEEGKPAPSGTVLITGGRVLAP